MICVLITELLGMPDMVVWPESTLDIVLYIKSIMAAIKFVQCQTINFYNFRQNN